MPIENKKLLIEKLTGVHSSKKSYYVALKEKIDELLKIKREWEVTFSAVTDLLVFINRNYEVQRINQAAVEFFTLPEDKIIGTKCFKLIYGRTEKCSPCLADQVLQSQKTAYQQSRTRNNRVLDIFAYPAFTEHDEAYGVTYYAKDVTRLIDSVKLASMGEMSAGVAHELNSPLTAIVGNSQLLLRETTPKDPHFQLIKDVHTSGIRCQRIIQNLLSFSRQDEFTFEKVDLNTVVRSALELAAYQIEKSKIDLQVNLCDSIPMISGSINGLEQIIVNLLLNAKDAVGDKMRRINDSQKGLVAISTRIHPDGNYAIVEVSDNGDGIPDEHVSQIFNPFYTTKKSGKGTGLGLSVSLGIAQSHGGFIDLDTTVGKGSTFNLILPLEKQ